MVKRSRSALPKYRNIKAEDLCEKEEFVELLTTSPVWRTLWNGWVERKKNKANKIT